MFFVYTVQSLFVNYYSHYLFSCSDFDKFVISLMFVWIIKLVAHLINTLFCVVIPVSVRTDGNNVKLWFLHEVTVHDTTGRTSMCWLLRNHCQDVLQTLISSENVSLLFRLNHHTVMLIIRFQRVQLHIKISQIQNILYHFASWSYFFINVYYYTIDHFALCNVSEVLSLNLWDFIYFWSWVGFSPDAVDPTLQNHPTKANVSNSRPEGQIWPLRTSFLALKMIM